MTIVVPAIPIPVHQEGRPFMVVPLADFEARVVHPWGKQVFARDARTALLLARAEHLDAFLAEHGRAPDGWCVLEWVTPTLLGDFVDFECGGWGPPAFFPPDAK